MEIRLRNGLTVTDPATLARRYFQEDAHELYDEFAVEPNNRVDLACLASTAFIESKNPQLNQWRSLWNSREQIESELGNIPPQISLTDVSIPWAELQSLFHIFLSQDGFSYARVTKILHKKRPHFIPIIDSKIITLYQSVGDRAIDRIRGEYSSWLGRQAPRSALLEEKWAPILIAVVQAFREDLIDNLAIIDLVRQDLREYKIEVTPVRVLDIILWQYARAR